VTLESFSEQYRDSSREELLVHLFAATTNYEAEIARRDQEIDKLHHLLIQAKKNLFGRKSEKLSEQQDLFTFAPEPEEAPEPVIEVKGYPRKTRKKRELPESLPRERIARSRYLSGTE
jgi:hypothetical protein